jgi:hypothetical protein
MKNTAYVITDGSHDGTLKVGGVAGKVVLHGDSTETNFQKCIYNAYDSTIVEFLAIEESINIIRGKVKKGAKVDHVVFATDSLDLICLIDPQQIRDKFPEAIPYIKPNQRYHKLAEKLAKITGQLGISFELMKVKAHVPDDIASPLEKIHNQVDLLAKEPKDRVVEALKVSNLGKGKTFTVMIPKGMSEEKIKKVEVASLQLVRQGYSPRVLLQEGAVNPLNKVMSKLEEQSGEGFARAARRNMRVTIATEHIHGGSSTLMGLNRSRARQWIVKEGDYVDEWELNGFKGALMNDIIKTTLGNAYSMKVIGNPHHKGRLTSKASEFVLHHGEESLMPDHLEMMTRAVKVHGIERVLVNSAKFETPEKKVNEDLQEMGY